MSLSAKVWGLAVIITGRGDDFSVPLAWSKRYGDCAGQAEAGERARSEPSHRQPRYTLAVYPLLIIEHLRPFTPHVAELGVRSKPWQLYRCCVLG